MAVRKSPESGDEELRINGFGRGYSLFALGVQVVGTAVIIAIMIAVATEWRRIVVFMGSGNRCTAKECAAMMTHLSLIDQIIEEAISDYDDDQLAIKLEQQRLQQQIDRIESEVFFGKRKPSLEPYAD